MDFEHWGVKKEVAEAFTISLRRHIAYVQEAGRKIGVLDEQLRIHDLSKWTREEFVGYALHFHGGGAPVEFSKAWLHHIHTNPHHWQHWIFPDGWTPDGTQIENGILEMPKYCALEMVADWMGASFAYTNSWNMADWLTKNIPRIIVHSKTAAYLRGVLDSLGYADVVYMTNFKGER